MPPLQVITELRAHLWGCCGMAVKLCTARELVEAAVNHEGTYLTKYFPLLIIHTPAKIVYAVNTN